MNQLPATQAGTGAVEDEVTWGLREIVYGILIALGGLVVSVFAIVSPVAAGFGTKSTEADVASAISTITFDLIAVWGVVFLVRRSGGSIRALGLRTPRPPTVQGQSQGFPWSFYFGLVGVGLFLSYVSLFSYVALVSLAGLDFLKPGDQIPQDYLQSDIVVFILGIGVVGVAPVCEELFFRGFVFGGLRRMWGFAAGALVSGFFFSSLHFQLGLIIPFAAIGVIFAFLYERSRSIFVSMSVHFCFNFVSYVLLVAQARSDSAASIAAVLPRIAL